MHAIRVSYTIAPEILSRFNEMVSPGERSSTIERLMEGVLDQQEKEMEAVAREFSTHPDFAEARADSLAWDVTVADGLGEPPL